MYPKPFSLFRPHLIYIHSLLCIFTYFESLCYHYRPFHSLHYKFPFPLTILLLSSRLLLFMVLFYAVNWSGSVDKATQASIPIINQKSLLPVPSFVSIPMCFIVLIPLVKFLPPPSILIHLFYIQEMSSPYTVKFLSFSLLPQRCLPVHSFDHNS